MGRDGRRALGCAGEDLACQELRRRGYEILARQFRTRRGEIDIVARHGTTDVPCRFDVVVVTPGPVPRVEVFTHAFAGS